VFWEDLVYITRQAIPGNDPVGKTHGIGAATGCLANLRQIRPVYASPLSFQRTSEGLDNCLNGIHKSWAPRPAREGKIGEDQPHVSVELRFCTCGAGNAFAFGARR